jgi:hypothetical protein
MVHRLLLRFSSIMKSFIVTPFAGERNRGLPLLRALARVNWAVADRSSRCSRDPGLAGPSVIFASWLPKSPVAERPHLLSSRGHGKVNLLAQTARRKTAVAHGRTCGLNVLSRCALECLQTSFRNVPHQKDFLAEKPDDVESIPGSPAK